MASAAAPNACMWEVTGGRWRFGGSAKVELAEAYINSTVDATEQASMDHDHRWSASSGRWSYVCDGSMLADGADNVAKTAEPLHESPCRVPDDSAGTPTGPQSTPGKPLCFLRWGSPDSNEAEASQLEQVEDDMETLEAVEPMLPGEFRNGLCNEAVPASPEGHTSSWKKISPAHVIPNAARQMSAKAQKVPQAARQVSAQAQRVPQAARQMSAQAHKAKGHVSEKVHQSFGYVREHTEGVPGQMSQTMQRSIGFVKGQTGSALKVPGQMSETAQKGLGYAKGKALEIARGMRRPSGRPGGA